MKNLNLYIIGGLLLAIVGGFFYFKSTVSDLNSKISDLENKRKEEVRQVRDSAFAEIDKITKISSKKFDSILNLPPKIKWKKYEKPIYIDRTLDDAIRIHSEYKADTRTK